MSSSRHPSVAIVEQFFEGRAGSLQSAQLVDHLLQGCPACAELTPGPWSRQRSHRFNSAAERAEERAYDLAVVSAVQRYDEERVSAPFDEKLFEMSPAELASAIELTPQLRTSSSLKAIRARAFEALSSDARESQRLLELAAALAERLPTEIYGERVVSDLRAAVAYQTANVHKLLGHFAQAEGLLDRAALLLDQGTGDPLRRARLEAFRASLRSEQGRFDEGESHMKAALRIYRKLGERYWTARVLIDLGSQRFRSGRLEESIAAIQEGLGLLEPEAEWRVALLAHHNLAAANVELGRLNAADHHLRKAKMLYGRLEHATQRIRLLWVEGLLAYARSDDEEAERLLDEVRAYFLGLDIDVEVASATLDLSLVYLRQHRWGELRNAAALVLGIYRNKQNRPGAIAALKLYQEAITGETLTVSLVRQLKSYLERLHDNPAADFQPD